MSLTPDGRRHSVIDCKYQSGTKLRDMPMIPFFHASKMKVLGVEGHLIKKIRNNELVGASALELLYLDNNVIVKIASGALKDAINLRFLSVRKNNLASIDGIFTAQRNLVFLDMADNEISSYGPAATAGLNSLRYLDLSSNPVEQVQCTVWDPMTSLQFLNMVNSPSECAIVNPGEIRCSCAAAGLASGTSYCDGSGSCSASVVQVTGNAQAIPITDGALSRVLRSNNRWTASASDVSEYFLNREWQDDMSIKRAEGELSSDAHEISVGSNTSSMGMIALIVIGSAFMVVLVVVVGKTKRTPRDLDASSEYSSERQRRGLTRNGYSASTVASVIRPRAQLGYNY